MIRFFADAGGFRSPFDALTLLRTLTLHGRAGDSISKNNAHAAQQLVYDAWEAATDTEEQALMFAALKLNPFNVDALLAAGKYAGLDGVEEIEYLRKVVKIGEKSLGKKFKGVAGAFWGCVETRPYMRARERLAECLRHARRPAEAIREWRGMLKLNPNDNQGIRYSLLPVLLMVGQLPGARKLFKQYPGETGFNTVFAWGKVLERFLSNDLPGAEKARANAQIQNSHTLAYITGKRPLPKFLPPGYSIGSKEEAVCFAEPLRDAWENHPAALQWLKKQKAK